MVKEMCIVTITKIYTSIHGYQTLIREIVTPTLPTFVKACLQILKPPASSKGVKTPHSLIEAVFESISTLLPLYPTTLRQDAAKIRADARPYLAATGYERALSPASLQESSRRLVVRLHMTATKGGDAIEWTKHIETLIRDFHNTADQVFRPVHESWESAAGYVRQQVDFDVEPQGGSDQPDRLPPWRGIDCGSERMVGLLDFIGTYLCCSTRSPVTIPISAIVDTIMRISAIIPPSHQQEKHELMQTNPAVGKEERDDFWAAFPDIQLSALRLQATLIQRLGRNFIPVAQESLEQALRIFNSSFRLPEIRATAFGTVKEILHLCGPTLPKTTVEDLGLVMKSCCRDLLGAAGHLKRPKQQATALPNGSKSKTVTQNADAFLSTKTDEETISVSLGEDHLAAAEALLAALFSSLPQQHVPSALRIRMLRTAILCQNKDAQIASVLHSTRDDSGRMPHVILPYLARQYPHDQDVELLRFNFRPFATGPSGGFLAAEGDMLDDEETKETTAANGSTFGLSFGDDAFSDLRTLSSSRAAPAVADHGVGATDAGASVTDKLKENPFLSAPTQTIATKEVETFNPLAFNNPLKRKSEEEDAGVTKRVEVEQTKAVVEPALAIPPAVPQQGPAAAVDKADEDDSDDESVHLNMELDFSSDEDDEGEDRE